MSVTYQVPEADMAEFTSTMRRVERQRRRTGARRWGLYRDLAAPDLVLEVFVVESWAEHLRQHDRRTTTDLVALDIVRPFVRGDVAVAHYVSAYSLADSDAADVLARNRYAEPRAVAGEPAAAGS